MENRIIRKGGKRRKKTTVRKRHGAFLNVCSEDEEDTSLAQGQKSPTLDANEDGWRQISRGDKVDGAILNDYSEGEEDTISPSQGQTLPTSGAKQDGQKKNSRGQRGHGSVLNDYSHNEEDTIFPSQGQKLPTSGAKQDGQRKKSKGQSGDVAIGVNEAMGNGTADKTKKNFNKNAHNNELLDEMGTDHLQGSDLALSDDAADDNESDSDGLSDMEMSTEISKIVGGRSIRGRGPYKGMDVDKLSKGRTKKLIVRIPPDKYFRPIGKYAKKLSSWLGYCGRSCGPPNKPWDEIEKKYRPRLWAMVQDYFDVSADSPEKWKKFEESGKVVPDTPEMKKAKFEHFCFHQMQKAYGRWKHKLKKQYDKYDNDDERMKHVPEELSPDAWKDMLKVFGSDKFKERSSINSTNRASQTVVSSTGPTSFAQVEYKMMDPESGKLPKASDVWKATHGIADEEGKIEFRDSESIRIYEEMQRIEDQPRNDDETPSPDDVQQQVLGVRPGVLGKRLGSKASTNALISSGQNAVINDLKNQVAKLNAHAEAQAEHINAQQKMIKAQEEREQERNEAFLVQKKMFDSYFRRIDSELRRNSSGSTQDSMEGIPIMEM